jgi:hypothetical protein
VAGFPSVKPPPESPVEQDFAIVAVSRVGEALKPHKGRILRQNNGAGFTSVF